MAGKKKPYAPFELVRNSRERAPRHQRLLPPPTWATVVHPPAAHSGNLPPVTEPEHKPDQLTGCLATLRGLD